MRDHVVAAAVRQFYEVKKELEPLLETLGPKPLVALVRQHHHTTGEDQGWAFTSIGFDQGPERMNGDPGPGAFYGELIEARDTNEGQAMKKVKIFLDPDSIDSIELETFED